MYLDPKQCLRAYYCQVKKTKLLSKLYKILSINEEPWERVKSQWEKDLAVSWTEEEWLNLKKSNIFCSQSTTIWENCYKTIYRWHLVPSKLKKMFPQSDGKCWHCQKDKADFICIWWGCGKLRDFWKQVHYIMQDIVGKEIPWAPRTMLLSDSSWYWNWSFKGVND